MRREVRDYHRRRLALIEKLGGKCAWPKGCGEDRVEKLHIDHVNGRGWEPREVSSHMRMKRYEAEAELGLLRVLCVKHNGGYRPPGSIDPRDVTILSGDPSL